jgi:ribose 5-phosphate isomerase B
MQLFIASDHAGFDLKEDIKKIFPQIKWIDLGTHTKDSTPYPQHAKKLCDKILEKKESTSLTEPQGVLICGSGVGVSMQANRFKEIRAALCWNEEVAKLSRQHNASNVLCLGARLISAQMASAILKTWLETPFEGGRHLERIKMMDL